MRQHVGMGRVQPESQRNVRRFPGGARRSDRKPRFDLIPFEFLESVAEVLTRGAVKYGPYNWKRGQKDFFLDAWNHAFVLSRSLRRAAGAKITWGTWRATWRSWSGQWKRASFRRRILVNRFRWAALPLRCLPVEA